MAFTDKIMKRVINWICSQNYTKSQLQNVTWAQLAAIADNLDLNVENLGELKKKIKPYKNIQRKR